MAALVRATLAMISLGTLALSACGELTPQEQEQWDALTACSDRATAAFHVIAEMPATSDEESTDEFRVDPIGTFIWEATVTSKDRPLPDRLTCRGNVKQRIVESVEFNSVVKRPSAQEVWKY